MVDIKKAKAEILEAAGKSKPPADFVAQEDIMDMMLKAYFNPASRAPKEMTLGAIVAAAQMAKGPELSDITETQVMAILNKYQP